VRKFLSWFYPHPESALNVHWQLTQLSLVLLPFNTLLGAVLMFLNSCALWAKYANQFVQSLLHQLILILGAWMVIIALFADRKDFSLLGLFNFLPFFIAFIAQSRLFRSVQQLRQLAWILVVPSVPISVLAIGQMFFGWGFHFKLLSFGGDGILLDLLLKSGGMPAGRASSLFYYATVLASYLVITFTVNFGLWADAIVTRKTARQEAPFPLFLKLPTIVQTTLRHPLTQCSFLGLSVGLNFTALFLTQSRNAWGIALAVIFIFSIVLGWRKLSALLFSSLGLVTAAAYGKPPLSDWARTVVPAMIWARVNDDLFLDRPIASLRLTQWKFAISLIEKRPWTGWGLRNFSALYETSTGYLIGHPHNLSLMLSCEMGIPATLLFYGLVGTVVGSSVIHGYQSKLSNHDRAIHLTLLLAFLCCTAFSVFDIPIFDARINLFGWILLAALWGFASAPLNYETQDYQTQLSDSNKGES
jgi:O-antigen ligase